MNVQNIDQKDNLKFEILGGKVVYMSPRPRVNHNRVAGRIFGEFDRYLLGKTCEPFQDGSDVHLTETDLVIPDVMIICNPDIVKNDGIHGVPDLIVEVVSPSSSKRDRIYKKDLYEKCGVKEYWIVTPETKQIEVYILKDGKYEIDDLYTVYPDYTIKELTEEEAKEYKTQIKVSLYDDLYIDINQVFSRII